MCICGCVCFSARNFKCLPKTTVKYKKPQILACVQQLRCVYRHSCEVLRKRTNKIYYWCAMYSTWCAMVRIRRGFVWWPILIILGWCAGLQGKTHYVISSHVRIRHQIYSDEIITVSVNCVYRTMQGLPLSVTCS